MKKEFLDTIINKFTKQEVCKYYSKRYVSKVVCNIGESLKIKFLDGGSFIHETVVDVKEDDYGYWVETTKKLWKFDYK